MKFTNEQIYLYTINIQKEKDKNDENIINFNLPININFFIQKNLDLITDAALLIEKNRNFIIKKYADIDQTNNSKDENKIIIKKEYIEQAQKELNDLMNIEQELDIKMIKLSDFNNVNITNKELKLIMFMIEDDLSSSNYEEEEEY